MDRAAVARRPPAHSGCPSGAGQAELRPYRRPVAQTSLANAAWASAVASSRSSVRPNRLTSSAPSRPPTTAPTGKPAMILGKLALIPAMSSSRPACPPMNTKPSWIRIGNRTRSGTDTQRGRRPGRRPRRAPIPAAAAPSTDERDAQEVEALRRPGDAPETRSRPRRSRCTSPGASRPVGLEEHRVGDDAQQRGHHAEHHGLGRSATSQLRSSMQAPGHVGVVSASTRDRSRSIATSAAMIPVARAGRSASSSSRTGRSIRSSVVGSSAVPTPTAARERAPPARRPSIPGPARGCRGRRGAPGVDPPHHRVHVLLHGPSAMTTSRPDLDLDRTLRKGGEGAAGNIGEQADAMERHDALDGGHRHCRLGRRRRAARPAARSGRSQARA